MFRKAAAVLAITLVFGSLSAARAEDPEEDFIEHLHSTVRQWTAMHHHGVPFSEAQWPNYQN
jgi:hypothetical protein